MTAIQRVLVRTAPIVATLLASGLLVVTFPSCGDTEEVMPTESAASASPSATISQDVTTSTPTQPARTDPPLPDGWILFTDPTDGFLLPLPSGLDHSEEMIHLPENDGIPATELRAIRFTNSEGVFVLGISVTPNPAGASLEDWIRVQPGWPCEPLASPTCEPERVTVDGEQGIRFSIDTLGDPAATVYFARDGMIYAISGNVFGSGDGGSVPPMAEAEFHLILEAFRFGS